MATSTITVQLYDTDGNKITTGGATVLLATTGDAVLSAVVDNNDGTYTATAVNVTAETVTISATVNGTEILDTADVIFQIGAPSPTVDPVASIVTATSPIEADGTATSTITVQLYDTDGQALTTGGGTVVLSSTGDAVLSAVTDNGGAPSPTVDPVTSIVTATSPIEANGSATSTITVQLYDTDGNPLTASGGTVTLATTGSAVLSAIVDNNDGTYTATATNVLRKLSSRLAHQTQRLIL